MAARTRRIVHDENTRAKIQASQIVNRLQKHILGEVDMSPTQVTAALGLLKKTLPDLQSMEVKAEVENTHRVINAKPLTDDEWERKHGDSVGTSAGSSARAN